MRNSTFFPFGLPPISNLEKRVAIQRRFLAQAEADLAEARADRPRDLRFLTEELEELPEAPDASSSVYHSPQHRAQHAIEERRRRGLPIEEPSAAAVAEFADLIRLADEKRRGVNQPDTLPAPPQQPPRRLVTAEEIIAAHRKATSKGNKDE
jgi:uncharacterized coiled-coil protein SlyX